jgi:hypothetical protein
MGRFEDEDRNVVLLPQPWHNGGTSYKVSAQFTVTQNIRGGVPVPQLTSSPQRKPFVDPENVSTSQPPMMSPKMLEIPKRFADEISDTGSETGSEFSVEYRPNQQPLFGSGSSASSNLRSSHEHEEEELSDEIVWPPPPPPPAFCPPPPETAPTPDSAIESPLNKDGIFNLPLSPVKLDSGEGGTFLEDSNLELQKELAFKFPTPSKPSTLNANVPVSTNPNVSQTSAVSTQEETAGTQLSADDREVSSSGTFSPSQEEEEMPLDSKLAAAVLKRDEEQKKKIFEARSKRQSLEMAETFYISGVDLSKLPASSDPQLEPTASQTSLSDVDGGEVPKSDQKTSRRTSKENDIPSEGRRTSKDNDPVKEGRRLSKDNGPLKEGRRSSKDNELEGKKKKEGLFGRFSLARLSGRGQHKVNQPASSRTMHDPLPLLPPSPSSGPTGTPQSPVVEDDGSHMYQQVDNATKAAILNTLPAPVVSDTLPYASIDMLQACLNQPPQSTVQNTASQPANGTLPASQQPSSVQARSDESGEFLSIPTDEGFKLTSKKAEHTICTADIHPGVGAHSKVGVVQFATAEAVNVDVVTGTAAKLQVTSTTEDSITSSVPNVVPTQVRVANSVDVEGTRMISKKLYNSEVQNSTQPHHITSQTALSPNSTGLQQGSRQGGTRQHIQPVHHSFESLPKTSTMQMVQSVGRDVHSGIGRKLSDTALNTSPAHSQQLPLGNSQLSSSQPIPHPSKPQSTQTVQNSRADVTKGKEKSKPPVAPKPAPSLKKTPSPPAANTRVESPTGQVLAPSVSGVTSLSGSSRPPPPPRRSSLSSILSQATTTKPAPPVKPKPPVAAKPDQSTSNSSTKLQEKPLEKPKPPVKPKPQIAPKPASVPSTPPVAEPDSSMYDKLSDFWDIPRSQEQPPSTSNAPSSQPQSINTDTGNIRTAVSEPQVEIVQASHLHVSTPQSTSSDGRSRGSGSGVSSAPTQTQPPVQQQVQSSVKSPVVSTPVQASHPNVGLNGPRTTVPTTPAQGIQHIQPQKPQNGVTITSSNKPLQQAQHVRQSAPENGLDVPAPKTLSHHIQQQPSQNPPGKATVRNETGMRKTASNGESQSLFLKKVTKNSDTIPHHLLVVDKSASLPRFSSPHSKPVIHDADDELDDFIRQLESEKSSREARRGKQDPLPAILGMCQKCSNPIVSQSNLVSYKNASYHSFCFICGQCGRSLDPSATFFVNEMLFCQEDYYYSGFRLESPTCYQCKQPVINKDSQVDIQGKVFHRQCMKCRFCSRSLGRQSSLPRDGQFVCLMCTQRLNKRTLLNSTDMVTEML